MENNEVKMPTSLLEELRMRKQSVNNAIMFIDKKREEYANAVKDASKFLEREEREIGAMRSVPIYVDLENFVEILAKEWGVESKNIVVDVKFHNTRRYGSRISKECFIKLHKNGAYEGKIIAHVTFDTKNKSHHLEINPFLNFLDFQKNGRRLQEFLEVETKTEYASYSTDFVCPDYKNLIIRFDFDSLVNFNSCEFDSRTSELLYEARVEHDINQLEKLMREND